MRRDRPGSAPMWVLMPVTLSARAGRGGPGRRVVVVTVPHFPAPGSTDIALSVRSHERVGERRIDEAWLDGHLAGADHPDRAGRGDPASR